MLSQQDRENILGWAYYWLRGQAEQTTKAAYCDVEAACCDDVAKVWFLIKVIGRAEGFLSDSQIDLLYQRLQCLIGLSTVTTCPANCFPCTPVEPPTPPVNGCSVFVKSGCCDYEVVNCKINNYAAWVCINLPEQLVPDGEVGIMGIYIFSILVSYTNITNPISRQTIIDDIIEQADLIGYGYYLTETGICIHSNEEEINQLGISTWINFEPSGSFTQPLNEVVSFCGNFTQGDVTIDLPTELFYYDAQFYETTFQVLINDTWTDVTDEIVDGTWQRTNVCDDVITEWRIIDSEQNVVASGEVTAICDDAIEITESVCYWLQAHQTAIEQLQNNPSTNQTLQSVTDEGNNTDNNIAFSGDVGVEFDNGSRVKKGTTNAGNGGNKGVALRCSVDYELKWEAGRLYVMEQDGFGIREVSHNFNITPTSGDDDTLGYFVGSRWLLDNGDVYVCSDASTGAAVWVLQTLGTELGGNTSQYVRGDGSLATFPTIPAAQIQSDWNQSNNAALDFIKNKPSIPTAVSQLSNDSGYQTASQVTNAIANAKPVTVVGVDATANALTGSVTNGVLGSILIPANTMTTNTIVELEAFLSKVSPSATPTHRVWINNANNISGATQIALQTGATGNQMSKLERTFIVTSTGLTIYPTTASANIDDNVANAAPTNVSVNWTVNQWLLHTANNASGETTTNVFLYAKKAQP